MTDSKQASPSSHQFQNMPAALRYLEERLTYFIGEYNQQNIDKEDVIEAAKSSCDEMLERIEIINENPHIGRSLNGFLFLFEMQVSNANDHISLAPILKNLRVLKIQTMSHIFEEVTQANCCDYFVIHRDEIDDIHRANRKLCWVLNDMNSEDLANLRMNQNDLDDVQNQIATAISGVQPLITSVDDESLKALKEN